MTVEGKHRTVLLAARKSNKVTAEADLGISGVREEKGKERRYSHGRKDRRTGTDRKDGQEGRKEGHRQK